MQIGALTLKLSKNSDKIDDLLKVDKDIKNYVVNNSDNITKNYNVSQINKSKTNSNLELINNHTNNAKSINSTLSNIQDDIDSIYTPVVSSKYTINNIYLFNLNKEVNFNFLSNATEKIVYETIINDNFMKDSYLEIYSSIVYLYNELKNLYHLLKQTINLINKDGDIIYAFYFFPQSKGLIARNISILKGLYYYKIEEDINYLKIQVLLQRNESRDTVEFEFKMSNLFQKNFVCIKYLKYNNIGIIVTIII